MKRISTFTLLAALGGLQGCITHAPPTCPDGLCDVGFAPLVPRDPRRVDIRPTGQHVPANAIAMGTFEFPGSAFDRCSDEVLDIFRKKAAKLGFDGVADISYSVSSNVPNHPSDGPTPGIMAIRVNAKCHGTVYVLRRAAAPE